MLGNYKNLVVLGQKRDFPLHRLRVPTSRGRHSTAETGAVCCHCEPSPAEGSVGGGALHQRTLGRYPIPQIQGRSHTQESHRQHFPHGQLCI